MARRTDKELWDALDKAGFDAELESELAMTPEERRQDLVKAGYDLDELRAEADAFFASLPAKVAAAAAAAEPAASPPAAPEAPSEPVQSALKLAPVTTTNVAKRRFPRVAILVPAALALAAGVFLWINYAQTSNVTTSPPQTPAQRAADIRDVARAECKSQHWDLCLKELDEARTLDPEGDKNPEVVDLRRTAEGHP